RGSRRSRARARVARGALGPPGAHGRCKELAPPGAVAGRCEPAGHGPRPCRAPSVLDEQIDSTSRERSKPLLEPAIGLARLAVVPGEGRAGHDVADLMPQHRLPELAELLTRECGAGAQRREDPQMLDRAQQGLAAAVALLHRELRGEGPAVQLEVELAGPD